MNIVILSAAEHSSATKSIIKAGEKLGHKMIVLDPSYLYLLVSDTVSGHDKIMDGYNQYNKPERIKAGEIDAVISRIGNNLYYGASVLFHFRNNLKIFTTQTSEGILTASDKMLTIQKLSAAKIKVPRTIIADDGRHLDFMINSVGGLPCICKLINGSQGVGVMILESKNQTNSSLQSFYKSKIKILLQEYIDGNSTDIRAIIVDNVCIGAMKRVAQKNEFRSNLSLDGTGEIIELSEADKEIAVKSANAVGLSVAGVDLMKSKDGTTYVIEVNGNMGFKFETVTGISISNPLIRMCEKYANKKDFNNLAANIETPINNVKTENKTTKGINWNLIDNLPHNKEVDKYFNS